MVVPDEHHQLLLNACRFCRRVNTQVTEARLYAMINPSRMAQRHS